MDLNSKYGKELYRFYDELGFCGSLTEFENKILKLFILYEMKEYNLKKDELVIIKPMQVYAYCGQCGKAKALYDGTIQPLCVCDNTGNSKRY